jgi:hypothetical protein
LDAVQTAAEIPAALAEALDVIFSGPESPQAEIINILRDKQLLLVIDNLEHVIEGGTEFLLEILQAAPKVVLLITSRERLNVQAEDLFWLAGLPYPDSDTDSEAARYAAIRLFADRAHRLNTMVECSCIFEACDDDRAEAALQLAADVLKRTAAGIDDPEMRATFLNNVPVNRQLQAALSRQTGG